MFTWLGINLRNIKKGGFLAISYYSYLYVFNVPTFRLFAALSVDNEVSWVSRMVGSARAQSCAP